MTDYQHILVERNEPIGIVTLNRPKELNALNFSLVSEWLTHWRNLIEIKRFAASSSLESERRPLQQGLILRRCPTSHQLT